MPVVDTSAQRGRGGDRDQFDEFDSDRGQFGSSDQPQYGQTSDDFKSQPGGGGYRQQSRDTGFEQQGSDTGFGQQGSNTGFGQQGSDTGFGQQGSDTSGVSQTRRAPGGEGYGYGPSAGGEFDQRETSYAGAHQPATSKGQTAGSEDTGAYGTSGTTQHEPSMMEKIKGSFIPL